MPSLSKVQIANLGLARIRATPIVTWEENSLEARECRRFYPILQSLVFESLEFSFATQRALLTETTNTRSTEWVYAYNLPSNLASVIRVLPDFEAAGLGFPYPLSGTPYTETWGLGTMAYAVPYIIEAGILYANSAAATVEYSINDLEGIALPAMVQMAIGIQLGAWLAVPVKGDRAREQQLIADTEIAWQRALADDRNRQPNYEETFTSEAMAARTYGVY